MRDVNGWGAGSKGADSRVVEAACGVAAGPALGAGPRPPPLRRRRRGRGVSVGVLTGSGLTRAEGDDAADRIVGGDADRDPVTRDHLDAEAPHAAAQLRQDLVARVYLHAIQPAAVDGNYGALNVNQVVLTQMRCPFTTHQV